MVLVPGGVMERWLKVFGSFVMLMWNATLDELQTGIKTAGRNTNNLRYADDTTILAESKAELKRPLVKVKEESEKSGLKLSIKS